MSTVEQRDRLRALHANVCARVCTLGEAAVRIVDELVVELARHEADHGAVSIAEPDGRLSMPVSLLSARLLGRDRALAARLAELEADEVSR